VHNSQAELLKAGRQWNWRWTAATAILGVLFTAAAWPGWMNGDSYTQWVEATGQFPVSDWHSAQLSTAWSWLIPGELGPRGPLLLQSFAFFLGLASIVAWVERRSSALAGCLFSLSWIAPSTWTVGWVIKDAYIVSCVSLSTGLLLMSTVVQRRLGWLPLVALSGMVLGVATAGRPYMTPVLAIWAVALVLSLGLDLRRGTSLVVLLSFILAFLLVSVAWPRLDPPYRQYVAGSTQLLDLARIECRARVPASQTPSRGAIPRWLIVNPSAGDICANYDPNFWDRLVWTAPNEVHVRLPTSEHEAKRLRSAWLRGIRSDFSSLAAAKIEATIALLTTQTNAEVPSHVSQASKPGGMGLGLDAPHPYGGSFPSRGGIFLAVVGAPADVAFSWQPALRAGVVWLVIVPLGALLIRRRRPSTRRAQLGTLLLVSSGLIWALVITVVAPAVVSRYAAPGEFMGIVAGALVLMRDFIPAREIVGPVPIAESLHPQAST
jgi:hypothetical protein